MGSVKILKAKVCFLKEAIRTAERVTTKGVDIVAIDNGKYIIPTIIASTTIGDIFSNNCLKDFLFCNPINKSIPMPFPKPCWH